MEELYRRYWRALVADAMRRLGDRSLAEDCAQETFLFLIERMSEGMEFENEFKLVGFLYRTNHNIARHMLRDIANENDAAEELAKSKSGTTHAYVEEGVIAEEMADLLDEALRSIPFHHAVATIFHIGYNVPYSDVADKLGGSKEAMRKYSTRGLLELREHFGDEEKY